MPDKAELSRPQVATAEDIERLFAHTLVAQTSFEFGGEGELCPIFYADQIDWRGKIAKVISRAELRTRHNKRLAKFREAGQGKLLLENRWARLYPDQGINALDWHGHELHMQERVLCESLKALAEPTCRPGNEAFLDLWGWIVSTDDDRAPTEAFSFPACALACGVDPEELRDRLKPLARGRGFSHRPLTPGDIERIATALSATARRLRLSH